MSSQLSIYPSLTAAYFPAYLGELRWLVSQPTPFTEPDRVAHVMAAIQTRLRSLLPNYSGNLDPAGNLVCIPRHLSADHPLLYLSAHVDTVPFQPSLWTAPFAPHPAFEDAEQLVAQGVNDCKAGVATQLWLAQLAAADAIALHNVIFTFTFKEEGAGAKTGVALGQAIGSTLPPPTAGSVLLVLENTVHSTPPYLPLGYTAESSSYTIRLTGSLLELQAAQLQLSDWRPVSITPVEPVAGEFTWAHHPPLGHVCTAPADKNPLRAALLSADATTLLRAGDERSHGTVPAAIGRLAAANPGALHRLTLTKRGFYPLADVVTELAPFAYTPVKPLHVSAGFDVAALCHRSPLGAAVLAHAAAGAIALDQNPGSSDATIITSSMPAEHRANLLPLVYGPGTRSQRGAIPPRLTHGPNETFIKAAGQRSLTVLLEMLAAAGHVRLPSAPA